MLKLQLKELMECKGYKANPQALRNLGISYTTAYKLLHDQVHSISHKHLEALCSFLNCTPNDLYRFIPDHPMQVPRFHSLWQIREKEQPLENPAELVRKMNPEQIEKANRLLRELVGSSSN